MSKALIVDYSTFARESYTTILKENGIECIEAENGLIALEILLEKYDEISTIIVNQEIPIMNGVELIKWVKKNKLLTNIPVIFLPTVKDESFIKVALELGVYDYLTEPINSNVFFHKVKKAIELHLHELALNNVNYNTLRDDIFE